MNFRHSDEIWRDFPQLVAGAAFATGISPAAVVAELDAIWSIAPAAAVLSQSAPLLAFPE